jgi:very-short-patch-repair endonuclease
MLSTAVDTSTVRLDKMMRWIHQRSGVAHSSELRAAGFRPAEIASAVASGMLRRVRRSWLVTPQCDTRRVDAASVGGRVTCVSAAELHGLWVPDRDPDGDRLTHVAVPGTSSRHDRTGLRLHWGTGPAPVSRNANEDGILNVLFHVAQCLPRRDATAVWESALRKKLTDAAVLRRVAWRRTEATQIASISSSLSDSGLETIALHGLSAAGVVMRQQVWIDARPVDGLIGRSLVVQMDGFAHHSSAADRRRDIESDARLVARGFVVLRFDYHQILFQWDLVRDTILLAIAQGAHRRDVLENR